MQDEPAQHGPVAALRAQRLAASSTLAGRAGHPRRESVLAVGRAPPSGTPRSRRRCSSAAFADSDAGREHYWPMYFTDRGHRGARSSAGVTRRSPWPGWPSGCRSSPTCTRSSRPPSSGSPPGWPASTTPRTDVGRIRPAAVAACTATCGCSLFRLRLRSGGRPRAEPVYLQRVAVDSTRRSRHASKAWPRQCPTPRRRGGRADSRRTSSGG